MIIFLFWNITLHHVTAQKMKYSIREFFSKYDQIRRKLRIWSHLLKKFLMENFNFCAVLFTLRSRIDRGVLINGGVGKVLKI